MLYLILFIIVLASLLYAWISLAPWVPSKANDLDRINKIADLKPGETFLEMGCGNGRVCMHIARKNPKAQVVGVELAFFFYLFTKIRVKLSGIENLKIVFGDALKYNISEVDVIYIFGLVESMNKSVQKKVLSEMKKGARLVSYVFSIKEWPGFQETHKGSKQERSSSIHLYKLT